MLTRKLRSTSSVPFPCRRSGDGEKSEQLWFTLRRALLAMGRQDLAEKAQAGGKVDDFRAEGFDFN